MILYSIICMLFTLGIFIHEIIIDTEKPTFNEYCVIGLVIFLSPILIPVLLGVFTSIYLNDPKE